MIPSSNFKKKVNIDFNDKGYKFSRIAEVNIIKIANKMDMSCDFSIKHNIQAVEWKLNAMNNKNKDLIIKLDLNWR